MTSQNISRRTSISVLILTFLIFGVSSALAAEESVQIRSVYPKGVVSPGSTVSFSAAANGFIDPKYAISDAFTGSGGTSGSIDVIGNFTWTPGVYDAGKHPVTVTVTDEYTHVASTTITINVAATMVFVKNLSASTIAVQRPVTFSIVAPGFVNPSYVIYDSNARTTISGGNVDANGLSSWTPTIDDIGTHLLTIGVSDAYGHSAQTPLTIQVIVPTIFVQALSPGVSAGFGSVISFRTNTNLTATTTFSVSDFFIGTSTVTANMINSAGLFSWKPVATDLGAHTLTVTATDAYNNAASTTVDLSVTTAQPSVSIPTSTILTTAIAATTKVTTPIQIIPVKKYVFTTYLVIGSSGIAVKELQKRLASLGYYAGPVTGYFGAMTTAAVKKFQSAHGIQLLGKTGPMTRAALNK